MYALPLSRPSQAIVGRQPAKARSGIRNFLSDFTDATFGNPNTSELIIYSAYDENEDQLFIDDLVLRATEIFGPNEQEPIGFHYPNGQPHKQQKYSWKISSRGYETALDLITEGHPWPKYNLGPIELNAFYQFRITKNMGRKLIEAQKIKSSLLVWFSSSSCCNANINFPFSSPSSEFWNYFAEMSLAVPFKLEPKNLRLVKPNKNRTSHVFSKIKI